MSLTAHHFLMISPPFSATKPPNTSDVMAESLMRMFMEGPEVSLRGSPTVSPTTAFSYSLVFSPSGPFFLKINGLTSSS